MLKISAITKELLHEETLIGTILSHCHAAREAKMVGKLASIENPIVSFGKKIEGSIAYGHEITEAALEHVRIRTSPKGKDQYFKRIAALDRTEAGVGQGHGLCVSAWLRTDAHGVAMQENGKYYLRLCYPGYPSGAKIASARTMSMLSTLLPGYAEFHQAREVGPFLDKTLEAAKAIGLPEVGGVINSSWSMGVANALTSNLYFKHRNIPTVAILGDAWKSSAAVQNISMRSNILLPLFNNSRAEMLRYSQPQLRDMLAQDVISVYPAIRDKAGLWTRTSLTAPPMPGELPVLKWLGLSPFGDTVGKVVHIDTKGLKPLERLPLMGDGHYRPTIAYHLYAKGADILHEISQVATAQNAGRSMM